MEASPDEPKPQAPPRPQRNFYIDDEMVILQVC